MNQMMGSAAAMSDMMGDSQHFTSSGVQDGADENVAKFLDGPSRRQGQL